MDQISTYMNKVDNCTVCFHLFGCSIPDRAAHQPYYRYSHIIMAINFSLKPLMVRPGRTTTVNGNYGHQHNIALKMCE